MAKEIKEIKKTRVKVPTKGTKQIDVDKDVSEIEGIRLKELIRQVRRLTFQNGKVLGVYIAFDVKADVTIIPVGSTPEIQKKAAYLATKFGDMVPMLIEVYEIPKMDVPLEKAKS